jgi:small GTP-binding protein
MPAALHQKICMVGSYGVGKTSLVRRFVESIFDERYLTNIGVKIDKKEVALRDTLLTMVIWDLAGEDEMTQVRPSHLRGAAGYILVADGCRPASLDKAADLHHQLQETLPDVPFVLALNKVDLIENWAVPPQRQDELRNRGWDIFETSAKTGSGVENVFQTLANKMLSRR